MYDASLDLGLRVDRLDRFREAAQVSTTAIRISTVSQLVENLEPELGTLGLLDPQSQHFLAPVLADAQRQIQPCSDRAFVADLQPQCIKVDNRIHGLKRGASAIGRGRSALRR